MLTLKKPFTKSSPEAPAAAEASVKGKQLLRGRTEAHVTRLMGEIDTARAAIAQAQEHLNERMVEGGDTTAAAEALIRAEIRLRALESVLTIARQKHEQAQAGLKHAEQQAQRERLREKLMKQLAVGKKIDEWLDAGTPLFVEFNACRKDLLEEGYPNINAQEKDADLSFQTYLYRPCSMMAGCVDPYRALKTDEKWTRPWSCMLPQPDQADQVRFALPEKTPIPGWKIGE
jgi:hypothetical protein